MVPGSGEGPRGAAGGEAQGHGTDGQTAQLSDGSGGAGGSRCSGSIGGEAARLALSDLISASCEVTEEVEARPKEVRPALVHIWHRRCISTLG
jgi:hypothetical protein